MIVGATLVVALLPAGEVPRPGRPQGSPLQQAMVERGAPLFVDKLELEQHGSLQNRKVVVGNQRQDGVAVGVHVDAEPLHVIDLVPQVRKKQVGSVDQRTRCDVGNCDPAQPHGNAGPPAKPTFQQQYVS
jgi:hypothetical protein